MKILHLTLKKQWFDMIAAGEKLEEYRDIKPYWERRLFEPDGMPKDYDIVRFRNGYSENAPTMDVQLEMIHRGFGSDKWGAENEKVYFVLTLGRTIGFVNYIPKLPTDK